MKFQRLGGKMYKQMKVDEPVEKLNKDSQEVSIFKYKLSVSIALLIWQEVSKSN